MTNAMIHVLISISDLYICVSHVQNAKPGTNTAFLENVYNQLMVKQDKLLDEKLPVVAATATATGRGKRYGHMSMHMLRIFTIYKCTHRNRMAWSAAHTTDV